MSLSSSKSFLVVRPCCSTVVVHILVFDKKALRNPLCPKNLLQDLPLPRVLPRQTLERRSDLKTNLRSNERQKPPNAEAGVVEIDWASVGNDESQVGTESYSPLLLPYLLTPTWLAHSTLLSILPPFRGSRNPGEDSLHPLS